MSEDLTTWLKHPLVNMVIGFLLTGVLGTAITQHFLDQREQERLRAQFALDTKQAIQQFSKLNEEQKERSRLVGSMSCLNARAHAAWHWQLPFPTSPEHAVNGFQQRK